MAVEVEEAVAAAAAAFMRPATLPTPSPAGSAPRTPPLVGALQRPARIRRFGRCSSWAHTDTALEMPPPLPPPPCMPARAAAAAAGGVECTARRRRRRREILLPLAVLSGTSAPSSPWTAPVSPATAAAVAGCNKSTLALDRGGMRTMVLSSSSRSRRRPAGTMPGGPRGSYPHLSMRSGLRVVGAVNAGAVPRWQQQQRRGMTACSRTLRGLPGPWRKGPSPSPGPDVKPLCTV